MPESAFHPSMEEINYFVVASLVIGAAFTAYSGELTAMNSLLYVLAAALVLLVREIGQRTIAQVQDAYVAFELSMEGSVTTILGAVFALVTQLPIILLFPIFNEFSGEKYEQWGKSIDAVWLKRQYWMVSAGIIALFLGWFISFLLDSSRLMEAFSLFTMFQLLPFNYPEIPTGDLDGSIIIRWSGFYWLVFFGLSLVMIALSI